MGQVYPTPADQAGLVERNLTDVWANFARLGHCRLIYTNTLSVLPAMTGVFERVMGC